MEMDDSRSREPHDAESENARLESDDVINLGGVCVRTVECQDAENVEISADELASLEANFRAGWTDCEAREITVAEIYLILNEPDRVVLEYEFLDDGVGDESAGDQGCQSGAKRKGLATAMEKLLSVARTQFINLTKLNKQASLVPCGQCGTCGGVQDSSPSNNRLRNNRSPATPKHALKRGVSPAAQAPGKITQRPGSNAAKKELDMNTTHAPAVATAPQGLVTPDLSVIAPAPVNEFRIPARPTPARPIAPAGPRVVEPMGQSRLFTPETAAALNNPAYQNRPMNLYQQLDAMTKRSVAPLARNKMRLKQIRPRSLMAKPAVTSRQLVSLSMVPGGENVQKGFMPISGVVARHIGPMPVHVNNTNGANVTGGLQATVIGVKPDDLDRLMANVISVNVQTPASSPSDFGCSVTSSSMTSERQTSTTDETSRCSISNILDVSLPPPDPGMGDSDSLIDMALNHNPTFSQYLNDASLPCNSTPTQSPLKLPDFFLNAESGDISLGSLLDSPVKRDVTLSAPSASLFNDSSRDSITNKFEVDTSLQLMMNETSVDYISKFADLAAQFTDSDHQRHDHVT